MKDKYVETDIMISMESKTFDRLSLSGPDNDFYQSRIRGRNPDPGERASKRRLDDTFSYLQKRILKLINNVDSLENKLNILSNLISVVDVDCSIINIVTEDRQYAYELFQVLNDREIQITVGDLLRAKTLQILEGYSLQQNAAERNWDDILKYEASDTKNFLSWIHSASKVNVPGNPLFMTIVSPRSIRSMRKNVSAGQMLMISSMSRRRYRKR